jgi:hypothetical protein
LQKRRKPRLFSREGLHDLQRAVDMEPFMEPSGSNPRWKRRKWLRVVARRAAEDLHDHPEIAVRSKVRDPGAGELTAEDHAVPPVGLRNVSSKSGVATATWWTPSRF